MAARRPSRAVLLAAVAAIALAGGTAVAAVLVVRAFALEVPAPLSPAERGAVMTHLRAALSGADAAAGRDAHALGRTLVDGGPVIVSVWHDGARWARVEGRGATLGAALGDAAARLTGDPALAQLAPVARARARLQVDIVVARGRWLARRPLLGALGVVAGVDGVGARLADGRELLVTGDELVLDGALDAHALPGVPDVRLGLDLARAEGLLARRAALPPGTWGSVRWTPFRFRADSFIERPLAERAQGDAPLPLVRGLPPGPPVTRATLEAAARAAARYLAAHLRDGRFTYLVDPAAPDGRAPDGGWYSLARHAGTTHFLAEVVDATGDPDLRAATEAAIGTLAELARDPRCARAAPTDAPVACVVEPGSGQAPLGQTALATAALARYRLATGDARHDPLLAALARWIVSLERADGGFTHLVDLTTGARSPRRLPYYDGEAALALALAHRVLGEPGLLTAAGRALDAIVALHERAFPGDLVYGEEHWTCLAAEAAWPALRDDRLRRFCDGYARFLRRQQLDGFPGQPDVAGGYGATPFVVPPHTPTASRTEAMVSAWLLGRHRGDPDERIRRQVLRACAYLLRHQLRPANDFWTRTPAVHGGFPGSAIDRTIRIDYVQHAGSALLRARALLSPDEVVPAAE